jgi:hypothetical protein
MLYDMLRSRATTQPAWPMRELDVACVAFRFRDSVSFRLPRRLKSGTE